MARRDDLVAAGIRLELLSEAIVEFCRETGVSFVGAVSDGEGVRTVCVGSDPARKKAILKLACDEADLESICSEEEG